MRTLLANWTTVRLPPWTWPVLLWLRRLVSRLQAWPPHPTGSGEIPRLPGGLRQPDGMSCASSVLVAMEMLHGTRPLTSTDFDEAALAMHRRTNGLFDRAGRIQLPWPTAWGTRPAAFRRQLGERWVNRVVDPWRPAYAYDAILAAVGAGIPVPLFIGNESWLQHLVLVTGASSGHLEIYDPHVGRTLRRSREQFETAQLRVAGWAQPWLVTLPRSVPSSQA